MMNPVILLSPNNNTRNATRKIFETLYIDPPFLVRNLSEAPAEIDVNEFIVSEAMKLACNDDKRVLILGIDKKDVIEKDIRCDKFDSLVRFLPYSFLLPDVLSMLTDLKKQNILKCEESCTAGRKKQYNIYAGKIIHNICHIMSHRNAKEFRGIIHFCDILRDIFVPRHDKDLVASFLVEMEELERLAIKFPDDFRKYVTVILYQEDFKQLQYISGGCNGYKRQAHL